MLLPKNINDENQIIILRLCANLLQEKERIPMVYTFKVGRSKTVKMKANQTFNDLCLAILKAYNMYPDHIFYLIFENGEYSESSTPLGSMSGTGEVSLNTRLKDRKLQIGETITFAYNPSYEWTRKVKLIEIE